MSKGSLLHSSFCLVTFTTPRTDHLYDLFALDYLDLSGKLDPDLYDLYDLCDVAHVPGWKPYNLHDPAHAFMRWICTTDVSHCLITVGYDRNDLDPGISYLCPTCGYPSQAPREGYNFSIGQLKIDCKKWRLQQQRPLHYNGWDMTHCNEWEVVY